MENLKAQRSVSLRTPVEFWMSVLLILFLLWLAVVAFWNPVPGATGFGIPLLDPLDAFYMRVKGDRDLGSALAVAALLWLGDRRALGALVLALTVEPILDCFLVASDPRGQLSYALTIHGSAAVYGLLLSWRLLRKR